jgi:hypothetical protein
MDSGADTAEAVGCPIRIPTDHGLLAAPRGFSQRAASFVASQCQGIHQMPFVCLIAQRAPRAGTGPPADAWSLSLEMTGRTRPAPNPAPETFRPPRSLHLLPSSRCHGTLAAGPARPGWFEALPDTRAPAAAGEWRRSGSNRRPHACKARALPTELRPRCAPGAMVGQGGFEPPTSRLSSARSDQLSY